MQVLACNSPLHSHGFAAPRRFGRREIFFDGVSSIYSHRKEEMDSIGATSSSPPQSIPVRRVVEDCSKDMREIICKTIPSTTRRAFATSIIYLCSHPSRYFSALALGDPSVTIEEVTPPIYPSGVLFPSEERIVDLFEKNTYSVVNIFDVTLRPQLNITGVVEVPEGNGSGVVWDGQGHIVTNYHVVGNALSRNPGTGQVVARVNILASEGVLKNFEGKLIGADRAKDLAVLKWWSFTGLQGEFDWYQHGNIYSDRDIGRRGLCNSIVNSSEDSPSADPIWQNFTEMKISGSGHRLQLWMGRILLKVSIQLGESSISPSWCLSYIFAETVNLSPGMPLLGSFSLDPSAHVCFLKEEKKRKEKEKKKKENSLWFSNISHHSVKM
ncbi:protease Do-like 8, chloroplastic isoform X3 [Magnolia sinica]|uniref:protease Do-like 8, chloroplastic isoform X3 n=1 Tax=Magnolia sinica TaxID=86752 RepID=UPI002659810B|nr:protease Do-like 8, chloroplastic isoform X3 [Magnolia sinica]